MRDVDYLASALKKAKGKWSAAQRVRLVNALGKSRDPWAVEPLSQVVLTDPSDDVRFMAVFALGQIGDPAGAPAVRREASSRWAANQVWAIQALAKMHDRGSVPLLVERLRSTNDSVRKSAANALGVIGDRAATLPLIEALDDPYVRRAAAIALATLGDPRALEPVRLAHQSAGGLARRRIGNALVKLEVGSDAQDWDTEGTRFGSVRSLLGRVLEGWLMNGLMPIWLMAAAAWDAIKIKPTKQKIAEVIEQGHRLNKAGNDRAAFDFLRAAVLEFPQDPQVRLEYATTLLVFKPNEVGREAAKAVELGCDDPGSLVRAAGLLTFARQWDDLRSCVARANELAEPDFVLKESLDNFNGILAAMDHEYERAEELLRSAVEGDQIHAIDLAKFLAWRGQDEEAIAVIDEALKHVSYKFSLERLRGKIVDGTYLADNPSAPRDSSGEAE